VNKYLIGQMTAPFFPVEFPNLQAEFDFQGSEAEEKQIGAAKIIPIPLDHPNGGYGYKIVENGSEFVFLTDNELGFGHPGGLKIKEYADIAKGVDLLLHDGQYTEEEYKITRSWGHSTYKSVVEFARQAVPKRIGLIHHDPEHLDSELDRYSRNCRRELKKSGVHCFGVRENSLLEL
jgi:ribonuclease BN (tRNA processing enzyme)